MIQNWLSAFMEPFLSYFRCLNCEVTRSEFEDHSLWKTRRRRVEKACVCKRHSLRVPGGMGRRTAAGVCSAVHVGRDLDQVPGADEGGDVGWQGGLQ